MKNTLKFLLCTMCCMIMFNNYGYSMSNDSYYNNINDHMEPNDKIIGKELFRELRNIIILNPLNYDTLDGPIMEKEFQELTGYSIAGLAQKIVKYHPEVKKYIGSSWNVSSYEDKIKVLEIAYNVMYNNNNDSDDDRHYNENPFWDGK